MKPVPLAQILLLAVIPAGLFLSSIFLHAIAGSYYLSGIFDPEYVYLLNSLNLLNIQPPSHTDHPGTTLQIFGAIVILGKWLLSCAVGPCVSLDDSVLSNPEAYLVTINAILNLFVAGTLVWGGLRVLRFSNMVLPAITLQLTMFSFLQIELALTRVSPELLLVLSVLVLILILIPEVFSQPLHSPGSGMARNAILTGMVLGFGMATKVTFFPMLGVVFLLKGRSIRLLAVCSCLAAFFVFTLPILASYPGMAVWFGSILVHQGQYGSSMYGFPEFDTVMDNFAILYSGEPLLFISLGFYLLAFFGIKRLLSQDNAEAQIKILNLLWIGCLIIAVQIAITAKHPGLHYMLPAMVFTGLLNAALVFLHKTDHRYALTHAVLIIGVLAVGLSLNGVHLAPWAKDAAPHHLETRGLLHEAKKKDGCLQVGYYRSPRIEYALAFGNSLSGNRYWDALQRMYPNAMFYNIWSKEFHSFVTSIQDRVLVDQINEGRCIVLLGSSFTGPYAIYKSKLVLTPLLATSNWTIYRLVGLRS